MLIEEIINSRVKQMKLKHPQVPRNRLYRDVAANMQALLENAANFGIEENKILDLIEINIEAH